MLYKKQEIDEKLKAWENYFLNTHLPEWDELPNIGLYMDQMISELEKYFDCVHPEIKDETIITKAMINNYVRMGYIPRPAKKRYYRVHIAYLIIICLLKNTLSISSISKGLPSDLDEETLKPIYNSFVDKYHRAAKYFCAEAEKATFILRDEENETDALQIQSLEELVISSALIGSFAALFAQKLQSECLETFEVVEE